MVGIAPSHRNQLGNYTSWLAKRGIPYKVLVKGETLVGCDLLLLCGGPDVGQNVERDQLEKAWFKEAYGKIPVLGICRGFQISNVILGGTLYHDLSEEKVKHTSNKLEIAGEPQPLMESSWHDVIFEDGKRIKVNSRHHQGIKTLAPGLTPIAFCADDDLLEMVTGDKSLFVQWHPERPDVWGTEAEEVVYEWLKNYTTRSKPLEPLDQIFNYLKSKNFTVVSNDRIRKSIDESFTDEFINSLVNSNPGKIKIVKDKMGRRAVKML
jgi:GMP synthase-like glutamine amidotransferase